MNATPSRIDPNRLTDFCTAVYASAGVPDEDARLIADTLVQADLWGHQSHGVLRLSWYTRAPQGGRLQAGDGAGVGRRTPARWRSSTATTRSARC